jgi:hypothetical protein
MPSVFIVRFEVQIVHRAGQMVDSFQLAIHEGFITRQDHNT